LQTENKMEESTLEISPTRFRSISAGSKAYTIRRGHRTFAKSIRITFTGTERVESGIVNSFVHTVLSEVPFTVFESEGFLSFKEALDILRIFYPELDFTSKVTIVEFRLVS
jgi:hypothetical protein